MVFLPRLSKRLVSKVSGEVVFPSPLNWESEIPTKLLIPKFLRFLSLCLMPLISPFFLMEILDMVTTIMPEDWSKNLNKEILVESVLRIRFSPRETVYWMEEDKNLLISRNSKIKSEPVRTPKEIQISRSSPELRLSSLDGDLKKPSRELTPMLMLELMPSWCTPSSRNILKLKLSWKNGKIELQLSLSQPTTIKLQLILSEIGELVWSSGLTITWEPAFKPCKMFLSKSTKTNTWRTLKEELPQSRKFSDSKMRMNLRRLIKNIFEERESFQIYHELISVKINKF